MLSTQKILTSELNSFFLVFIYAFIDFWLCWVFAALHSCSLVAAVGAYSLAAVPRLLIVVASFVVECGL